MNTAASSMAGQMLNGIIDNMNNTVRTQLLDGLKAKGATLTADQVSNVVTPITKKVTNVNETGKNSANGNSPMSLFQPLWIASLASAAIIFMAISKMPIRTRKENFCIKTKANRNRRNCRICYWIRSYMDCGWNGRIKYFKFH